MAGVGGQPAAEAPTRAEAAPGAAAGELHVELLEEEAFPTLGAWAEAVARVTRRAFARPAGWAEGLEGPGGATETVAQVLADRERSARIWVARTPAGDVAGTVRGVPQPDGSWELKRLGVVPEHRRGGVAGLLVRTVEAAARAAGAPTVRLHCVVERLLPEVYAHLGYRVVKRWAHAEKALTVVAMERDLTPPAVPYPGPWEAEAALPARGVYVLWLWLPRRIHLPVPAPGGSALEPGLYAYVGSAQRALPARLERHVAGGSVRHWHVDHLRAQALVVGADVWSEAPRETECRLAERLARTPGAGRRIPRFGSGDCGCAGHLVGLGGRPEDVTPYLAPRRLQPELLAVFRPLRRPWAEGRHET
ncbi:GNAT family N-acetyltransferase [Limnochorda pilosa]|uniref:N-acetyltransferase domain-containing protein n=1 Tax=Limnochorda pilosa TaxID=1555112 RepID=A0A0K2SKX3_LIMPI|nr:GNAT family N-acetyltransferase [Limnochorda pilosa]BAS27766.1 hypothetical protein LIP_1925 [Limnochorda pilosa]